MSPAKTFQALEARAAELHIKDYSVAQRADILGIAEADKGCDV